MSLTKREFTTELIDARSLFQERTQADHLASGHTTDNSLFHWSNTAAVWPQHPSPAVNETILADGDTSIGSGVPYASLPNAGGCVGAIKQYQSYGANQH